MVKSSEILNIFESIAGKYDFLNDIISLGRHKSVKKQAIKNAGLKKGMEILDLCTGTGDIAVFISDMLRQEVCITAVDFSPNMLYAAKKKACLHKNIKFLQADVMDLPFEDGTFDSVFISFGLRNLENLEKAVQEMKRVVKTGGTVVNIDTGKPDGLWGKVFKIYFFHVVPFLGKIFSGNRPAYSYLPESTENFPAQRELVEIFRANGFRDVKNYNFAMGAIAQQVAVK